MEKIVKQFILIAVLISVIAIALAYYYMPPQIRFHVEGQYTLENETHVAMLLSNHAQVLMTSHDYRYSPCQIQNDASYICNYDTTTNTVWGCNPDNSDESVAIFFWFIPVRW